MAPFKEIYDQYEMRKDLVLSCLKEEGVALDSLDVIMARGGLLPPGAAGAIRINDDMIHHLRYDAAMEHASNLAAPIALGIAREIGLEAFVYDPVSIDEMEPIARISGLKEIERSCLSHGMNMRAAAIQYAKESGKSFKELSLVVAHLGGGITLCLMKGGRMIDVVSDDEGPFSPERSGGLPIFQLLKMATQPDQDYKSIVKKLRNQGGLVSYFGTNDARKVQEKIEAGDEYAALVYEAMAEDIAKSIGKLSVVARGKLDAIILTGGIAKSKMLTDWISQRVEFIAPVVIIPGENEMLAMALGALRVFSGEEQAQEFERSNKK
jgi:butyrate kinase